MKGRYTIMDVQVVQGLISSVGFPIFVAVWMLYKSSQDSAKMSESLNELRNAITELTALMKHEKGEDDE